MTKEQYDGLIKKYGLSFVRSELDIKIEKKLNAEQKAELAAIEAPEIYYEKILPFISGYGENELYEWLVDNCREDSMSLFYDKATQWLMDDE